MALNGQGGEAHATTVIGCHAVSGCRAYEEFGIGDFGGEFMAAE
jgi:hypothetical protein